jgi:hypothetical protein
MNADRNKKWLFADPRSSAGIRGGILLMWYRVFSLSLKEVLPSALAAHLHAIGLPVEPHFKGDDLGWTSGELRFPGGGKLLLDRYLTDVDDLRPELNAFAAELEASGSGPATTELMRRVIQTRQMVTLRCEGNDSRLSAAMVSMCRFLAAGTDGVYQIDGRGWFAADGTFHLAG